MRNHAAFTWDDGHRYADHHRRCPQAGGSGPWLHLGLCLLLLAGMVVAAWWASGV